MIYVEFGKHWDITHVCTDHTHLSFSNKNVLIRNFEASSQNFPSDLVNIYSSHI